MVRTDTDTTTVLESKTTFYPHLNIKIENGAGQYLHRDHLSSVRAATDASGSVVENTTYAAYGERSASTAPTTSKGTIGERFAPELGVRRAGAGPSPPA
ncbi:MAG: hypothetical protein AAFO17_12185 [Pseudomonadota bacterium]